MPNNSFESPTAEFVLRYHTHFENIESVVCHHFIFKE